MVFLLLFLASSFGLSTAFPVSSSETDLLTTQLGLTRRAPEDGVVIDIAIHESCNGTQRAQISQGLQDMKTLAQISVDRLFRYGPGDEYFVKYFGEGADPAPVIGYFEEVLFGDKTGALLRCDNPDDNCRLPEWAGHWRGDNATQETVICNYSYTSRRPLSQICGLGFQLARDNPSIYWGSDLLHRSFHVPKVAHEMIHHVSNGYNGALELAKTNVTGSVSNQNSLQYYSLDVYSRTIVDEGCLGTPLSKEEEEAKDSHAAASSTTLAPAAQETGHHDDHDHATESADDCHTHADGSIHCGAH